MTKLNQVFYTPSSTIYSSGASSSDPSSKMSQGDILKRFIPLVLFFICCIIGALYFISPYSEVETLTVEGSEEVLDQQVIDFSGVRSGDSLWGTYFEREQIENQIIHELPQVSDVSLSFSGINDFTFEIEEYETVAYLSDERGYLKVLENGEILEEEYTTSIGNQPVFLSFEEGTALDRIISEFEELDTSIQDLISEVEHIESEHNPLLVRVYMNNGNQVLASIPNFSDRLAYYPQMVRAVEGQYGVFDLEAGAFFIPFVDNDPESEELEENEGIDLETEEAE